MRLVLSPRIRQTPFEQRVIENGAKNFTVYNHMTLASFYESNQADYDHLCEHVQIWDVACERQVEVVGADASKLIELITPRDMSKCQVGQCVYAPLVDENGKMINDPIIIKLADDRYWVSIADSDVLLWLRGIAFGRGYDVRAFEPDVSPLAIQGAKSDALMTELLGRDTQEIKFFWFERVDIAGMNLVMARSGWGGQGGFEIYLEDSSKGLLLWDTIWKAGQKYHIRAGCPNAIDRIESGLLSFGNDMTLNDNPIGCGLDRFFRLDKPAEYMSRQALNKIANEGSEKTIAYLQIEGEPLVWSRSIGSLLDTRNQKVGMVTSVVYSQKFGTNLAFANLDSKACIIGNRLQVDTGAEMRTATICNHQWKD